MDDRPYAEGVSEIKRELSEIFDLFQHDLAQERATSRTLRDRLAIYERAIRDIWHTHIPEDYVEYPEVDCPQSPWIYRAWQAICEDEALATPPSPAVDKAENEEDDGKVGCWGCSCSGDSDANHDCGLSQVCRHAPVPQASDRCAGGAEGAQL